MANNFLFILNFILISVFAQNPYDLAIHKLIESKKEMVYTHKLRIANVTSTKKTHYTDLVSFIKDSLLMRKLINYNNGIEIRDSACKLNIPIKYLSKKKYNTWYFDSFLQIDQYIFISGNLMYKKGKGGSEFVMIIKNDSIIEFYHGGYPP